MRHLDGAVNVSAIGMTRVVQLVEVERAEGARQYD